MERTNYPHVVKIDGVSGAPAVIEETRMAVWHIVEYYYRVGMSVEEIVAEWNYLTPAKVFSALAYYDENREEIDEIRRQNSYERWLEQTSHAAD